MSDEEKHVLLSTLKFYMDEIKNNVKNGRNLDSETLKNLRETAVRRLLNTKLKEVSQNYLKDLEEALKVSGLCYFKLKLRTEQNLIIGWSPIYFITEVPLSWDILLDVPYIPGSTVKGIIRSFFEEINKNINFSNAIFGSKNDAGRVVFFDAYPTGGERLLAIDIINPHYNRGTKTEYDVQPIPVKFLAIRKGVEFTSYIAFYRNDLKIDGNDLLQDLLKAILFSIKMGWGRMTARGYGELGLVSSEVEISCQNY